MGFTFVLCITDSGTTGAIWNSRSVGMAARGTIPFTRGSLSVLLSSVCRARSGGRKLLRLIRPCTSVNTCVAVIKQEQN